MSTTLLLAVVVILLLAVGLAVAIVVFGGAGFLFMRSRKAADPAPAPAPPASSKPPPAIEETVVQPPKPRQPDIPQLAPVASGGSRPPSAPPPPPPGVRSVPTPPQGLGAPPPPVPTRAPPPPPGKGGPTPLIGFFDEERNEVKTELFNRDMASKFAQMLAEEGEGEGEHTELFNANDVDEAVGALLDDEEPSRPNAGKAKPGRVVAEK